jgi:hypothetical protein
LLFVSQPILILRLLPRATRQQCLAFAQRVGVLDHYESQRNMYARQVLNLESEQRRFYYSVLPTLAWLRAHTGASDRVLTDRDELYLLEAQVIGTSNGFLGIESRSSRRLVWQRQVMELDGALAAHDTKGVRAMARETMAIYAVVPWSEPGAVFADSAYSVIESK